MMDAGKYEQRRRTTRSGTGDARGPDHLRSTDIARKLSAAERLRHRDTDARPEASAIRASATARKLRRAEGIEEPASPPPPLNERKALERTERENRLKAGGSGYREALIRVGLGNVDTPTLLIFAFSIVTMLILPLIVILSS